MMRSGSQPGGAGRRAAVPAPAPPRGGSGNRTVIGCAIRLLRSSSRGDADVTAEPDHLRPRRLDVVKAEARAAVRHLPQQPQAAP